MSDDTDFFLKTYFLCEKFNGWPNEGGLFEQDSRLMEAFSIINSEINKFEKKKMDEQTREMDKQKRKSRGKNGTT